jgi:hypothetical protein
LWGAFRHHHALVCNNIKFSLYLGPQYFCCTILRDVIFVEGCSASIISTTCILQHAVVCWVTAPSNLALSDRSQIFSDGCREDIFPCNVCPDCYVLDNDDSYSRLSNDVQPSCSVAFPCILVLVLLLMVIDNFIDCARAHSLGIAAQIKIMGEPSLIFSYLSFFLSIFSCLGKSIRLCYGRKRSLKTLKIC